LFEACSSHRCSLVQSIVFPACCSDRCRKGFGGKRRKKTCRKENVVQESNRNIFDSTLSFRYFPFRHFSFRHFPPHVKRLDVHTDVFIWVEM